MDNKKVAERCDDNKRKRRFLVDLSYIVAGSFFLALSVNVFLSPNKLSGGGVTAVGTVLFHVFSFPIAATNLAVNAVLFAFGYRYLGKYAVVKTALGIVFLSFFLQLTSYFPTYCGDMLAASVVGGLLMGLGIGLAVRPGASTGGTDFAALILRRFVPHLPIATLIIIMDCAIVIVSGVVFRSFTVTVYSMITLFISSKMTDATVSFGDSAKSVYIFSDSAERIADLVMDTFDRGATGVPCRGMYSRRDRMMLFCVISPKQLPRLMRLVREIDKKAFIVVNNATEVLGEGFKLETPYDDIDISPNAPVGTETTKNENET